MVPRLQPWIWDKGVWGQGGQHMLSGDFRASYQAARDILLLVQFSSYKSYMLIDSVSNPTSQQCKKTKSQRERCHAE